MTETIQIISKAVFRFKNPDPNTDVLKLGGGGTNQLNFSKAYFETTPGVVQTAPAWIKQDKMYEWAEKDNDIMEIVVRKQATATDLMVAAAAQQSEQAIQDVEEQFEYDKMKKDELIQHALEHHELELDPSMKKDEMIRRIRDVAKGAPVSE